MVFRAWIKGREVSRERSAIMTTLITGPHRPLSIDEFLANESGWGIEIYWKDNGRYTYVKFDTREEMVAAACKWRRSLVDNGTMYDKYNTYQHRPVEKMVLERMALVRFEGDKVDTWVISKSTWNRW
jgi:hypothetical protein